MKKLFVLGYLLAAISAWIGCSPAKATSGTGSSGASTSGMESTSQLYEKDWRLVSIQGELVDTAGMRRLPGIRFSKADHRVLGNGGCNSMGGTYTITGDKLHFSPLISTRMACPSLGVENNYFRLLAQATRFEVSDGRLELFGDTGSILIFAQP